MITNFSFKRFSPQQRMEQTEYPHAISFGTPIVVGGIAGTLVQVIQL